MGKEMVAGIEATEIPELGTAWLLLQHGGYLAASIAILAVGLTLSVFAYTQAQRWHVLRRDFQMMAIGFHVGSFLLMIWIMHAIVVTWAVAYSYPTRVFGHASFAAILVLVLYFAVWNFRLLQLHRLFYFQTLHGSGRNERRFRGVQDLDP